MMDLAYPVLFGVGLLIGMVVGWYLVPLEDELYDEQAGDWPDEDSTLDVMSHWGDSRPTRGDRLTAYRRWEWT